MGNEGSVGIYQRVFGDQACQRDHLEDVHRVSAWVFDDAALSTDSQMPDLGWPTDCVELNDIVDAHLSNAGNVGVYQQVFGDHAEPACRNDHRDDVRGVFAWAFGIARVSAMDAGYCHHRGLKTDGTIACWGSNDYGQASPPMDIFHSVSAGDIHTYGVPADGTGTCWGRNRDG